jgi:heat shock protein HtpX
MLGNGLKTSILMAGIMALFGAIGGYFGGSSGMLLALLFAGGMNLFAYWFSDSMVLRMYNAQEVDEASAPQFYATIRELAQRADLPMPRVYLIDEAQPNAFATGRNPEHAAVAATTGILHLLSAREIRGVMAHELAHVRHRDILISTISATMAGAISALANFAIFFGGRDSDGRRSNPMASVVAALLAPLAASLIQMAISRAREFEADRGGAEICGDPNALADALSKIDAYARGIRMPSADEHPATAQMMIMNPLAGGGLASLFSTHPPTEERVDRLREMSGDD